MKAWILAASLAATPGASLAAGCQEEFGALIDMLVESEAIETAPTALVRQRPNDWCGVRALRIKVDARTTLAIEELAWRGEETDRFVSNGLPPTALEIDAKGVRVSQGASSGEEIIADLLSDTGTDVIFSAWWDADARRLNLVNATAKKDSGDEISLAASIDNVDLTSLATIQLSGGSLSLASAVLTLRTVEAFAPYVRGMGDVEAVEAWMDGMPADTLDAGSRRALSRYAEEGPVGDLTLRFVADGGFGALRFAPFFVSGQPLDPAALWQGVEIDVSFSPL